MENWICPECLEKYEIEEQSGGGHKMGICPMCKEYRHLVKAEPLKESGTEPDLDNEEVIEWLAH